MRQDTPISSLESTALCQGPAAVSTRPEARQSRPAGLVHLAPAVLAPRPIAQAIVLGNK